MKVRRAILSDVAFIAPLFNEYRIFYNQETDLSASSAFLEERLRNNESIIFVAINEGEIIGFTQLYKTFSSVSLQPFYILNDLFVALAHRKKGAGEALLKHSKIHCTRENYKGLALETTTDNPAQKLYERLEWKKDEHCFHYFWKNTFTQ